MSKFKYLWITEKKREPDTYFAFRGFFILEKETDIEFRILGAHWFQVTIDGDFFTEGPARFTASNPEFEIIKRKLPAGKHVVAATVHNHELKTRTLDGEKIPPFFSCNITNSLNYETGVLHNINISWKYKKLEGYIQSGERISELFSWIEWVDTQKNPTNWQEANFDDSLWKTPVEVYPEIGKPKPLELAEILHPVHNLSHIAEGYLSGPFESTEIPKWEKKESLSWYHRNLLPENSGNGIWRRYDLGRVRLGRAEFTLDLPEGAIVEFGYSEYLTNGKVVPFGKIDPVDILRNIDHFIARGGVQIFSPITPKGGRYIEVHIKTESSKIKFIDEKFVERIYYRNPIGCFTCNDEQLNKIWLAGMRTLSACSEDAITDNPSRERGQWLGDQLPSIAVASSGYSDLRPFKRSLRQATFDVFEDGMVPGVYPSIIDRLQSFSLLWLVACFNYYKLTGDKLFLEELFQAAEKNLKGFENNLLKDIVDLEFGWIFIDWGCSQDTKEAGLALRIFYYIALKNMCKWCEILAKNPEKYLKNLRKIEKIIKEKIKPVLYTKKVVEDGNLPVKNRNSNMERRCSQHLNSWEIKDSENWESIGYHSVALALSCDIISSENKASAINYLKSYILNCFPNNPDAPKLTNPGVLTNNFITPYFSYFVFPALIENGEIDFVLEQYKSCWGWILNQGLSTISEVFDLNWSHAHVWGASPTAQLSQYVLGLKPCYEKGYRHFNFSLFTGNLKNAKGSFPFPFENKVIKIEWQKTENGIEYKLETPVPIWLHFKDKTKNEKIVKIKNSFCL